MPSSVEYNSEGFDLDALPNDANKNEEVVYEIGGRASSAGGTKQCDADAAEDGPASKAEELKSKGNQEFKAGNFLDAYDYYSDAIDACPGANGADILKQKSDHEDAMREKAYQCQLRDTDRRIKPHDNDDDNKKKEHDSKDGMTEFEVPSHEFGDKLSVYHCNRAATLLQLCRYEEAIEDCNIALLLNPKYVKALIRRMTAYEKTDRFEEALRDAKEALSMDPTHKDIRRHVNRLQKIEDERLEKLKEETMGKLKDLGNSLLSNFGMSLDNFKAEKDPNTGSYSISYQN